MSSWKCLLCSPINLCERAPRNITVSSLTGSSCLPVAASTPKYWYPSTEQPQHLHGVNSSDAKRNNQQCCGTNAREVSYSPALFNVRSTFACHCPSCCLDKAQNTWVNTAKMWRRGGGVFGRAVYSTYLLSTRMGKAVLLDVCSANQQLTAPRSWRQQSPEPPSSWVHAQARLGMLLSPPWAFSSLVGQDPWAAQQGLASVARPRDRFQRPGKGTPQEGARKMTWWELHSACQPSAQGTGCSVAGSGRADGMYITESEGLWETHH